MPHTNSHSLSDLAQALEASHLRRPVEEHSGVIGAPRDGVGHHPSLPRPPSATAASLAGDMWQPTHCSFSSPVGRYFDGMTTSSYAGASPIYSPWDPQCRDTSMSTITSSGTSGGPGIGAFSASSPRTAWSVMSPRKENGSDAQDRELDWCTAGVPPSPLGAYGNNSNTHARGSCTSVGGVYPPSFPPPLSSSSGLGVSPGASRGGPHLEDEEEAVQPQQHEASEAMRNVSLWNHGKGFSADPPSPSSTSFPSLDTLREAGFLTEPTSALPIAPVSLYDPLYRQRTHFYHDPAASKQPAAVNAVAPSAKVGPADHSGGHPPLCQASLPGPTPVLPPGSMGGLEEVCTAYENALTQTEAQLLEQLVLLHNHRSPSSAHSASEETMLGTQHQQWDPSSTTKPLPAAVTSRVEVLVESYRRELEALHRSGPAQQGGNGDLRAPIPGSVMTSGTSFASASLSGGGSQWPRGEEQAMRSYENLQQPAVDPFRYYAQRLTTLRQAVEALSVLELQVTDLEGKRQSAEQRLLLWWKPTPRPAAAVSDLRAAEEEPDTFLNPKLCPTKTARGGRKHKKKKETIVVKTTKNPSSKQKTMKMMAATRSVAFPAQSVNAMTSSPVLPAREMHRSAVVRHALGVREHLLEELYLKASPRGAAPSYFFLGFAADHSQGETTSHFMCAASRFAMLYLYQHTQEQVLALEEFLAQDDACVQQALDCCGGDPTAKGMNTCSWLGELRSALKTLRATAQALWEEGLEPLWGRILAALQQRAAQRASLLDSLAMRATDGGADAASPTTAWRLPAGSISLRRYLAAAVQHASATPHQSSWPRGATRGRVFLSATAMQNTEAANLLPLPLQTAHPQSVRQPLQSPHRALVFHAPCSNTTAASFCPSLRPTRQSPPRHSFAEAGKRRLPSPTTAAVASPPGRRVLTGFLSRLTTLLGGGRGATKKSTNKEWCNKAERKQKSRTEPRSDDAEVNWVEALGGVKRFRDEEEDLVGAHDTSRHRVEGRPLPSRSLVVPGLCQTSTTIRRLRTAGEDLPDGRPYPEQDDEEESKGSQTSGSDMGSLETCSNTSSGSEASSIPSHRSRCRTRSPSTLEAPHPPQLKSFDEECDEEEMKEENDFPISEEQNNESSQPSQQASVAPRMCEGRDIKRQVRSGGAGDLERRVVLDMWGRGRRQRRSPGRDANAAASLSIPSGCSTSSSSASSSSSSLTSCPTPTASFRTETTQKLAQTTPKTMTVKVQEKEVVEDSPTLSGPREYSLRNGFPLSKAVSAFTRAVLSRALTFSDDDE